MTGKSRLYPFSKKNVQAVEGAHIEWIYSQFAHHIMSKFNNIYVGVTIDIQSSENTKYDYQTYGPDVSYIVTFGLTQGYMTVSDMRLSMLQDWTQKNYIDFLSQPTRCVSREIAEVYGEVLKSAASGGEEEEE